MISAFSPVSCSASSRAAFATRQYGHTKSVTNKMSMLLSPPFLVLPFQFILAHRTLTGQCVPGSISRYTHAFVTVHGFAAHSNMMHTYNRIQVQNSIVMN